MVSVLSAVDVIVVRVDWNIVNFRVDITVDNNEEVFVVNVDTTSEEVDIVVKVEAIVKQCF